MINKPTLLALNAAGAPMPLARELGERLGVAEPIPELQPIDGQTFRLTRAAVWPPEVLAEIRAIYAGEIQ